MTCLQAMTAENTTRIWNYHRKWRRELRNPDFVNTTELARNPTEAKVPLPPPGPTPLGIRSPPPFPHKQFSSFPSFGSQIARNGMMGFLEPINGFSS